MVYTFHNLSILGVYSYKVSDFNNRNKYLNSKILNPLYSGNPTTSTFENIEDQDEMQHYAAFHQGLHCL